MKTFGALITAVCVAGAVSVATAALAQAPAALPSGEIMLGTVEVTAKVTEIDHATREVTLRNVDGEEFSFIASDEVKNLAQVQQGDVVTVAYAEALAYDVKKGGQASDAGAVMAGGSAEPGRKPAGVVARQTMVTVLITAIDPKVPSVTFKGPDGNTRTIKVRHAEKLQGVSVGDTVDLTYTEALGIKVEEAPGK